MLDASAPRHGGTTREVLDLAAPAVLSGFVQMAYHWVNQVWVGRLGDATSATAALSVSSYLVWAYHAATALVAVGLAALVGRYSGGGRHHAARWIATQGLRWTLALALLGAIPGALLAPWIFEQTHVSESAAAAGVGYARVFFLGGFALALQVACDAIWRGHGTTRVPLLTSVLGLGLNAALDPLLIFGAGPIPALGVPGAAIATVVSAACATTASFCLLVRRGHLDRARPTDAELRIAPTTPLAPGPLPGLDLAILFRLVRVGLPVAAGGLFFVFVYFVLSGIVTRAGGDPAQAGLGIGIRGEQVAYFLCEGFSFAAGALVARRLGAGQPEEAARCAWRATSLANAGCLAWSVVLVLFPEALADLFLPGAANAEARGYAVSYFLLVSLCLAPQAWEIVLEGAFGGAGMTLPPMLVSIALTGARIPLAWWAAFGLGHGPVGVWVVIVATAAVRGIVSALWFARGTWKHRTV